MRLVLHGRREPLKLQAQVMPEVKEEVVESWQRVRGEWQTQSKGMIGGRRSLRVRKQGEGCGAEGDRGMDFIRVGGRAT